MKMEAVSITSPDVLEVATVVQIASRLVKLRFSSQGKADIWMDCESPDLYPGDSKRRHLIFWRLFSLRISLFQSDGQNLLA